MLRWNYVSSWWVMMAGQYGGKAEMKVGSEDDDH